MSKNNFQDIPITVTEFNDLNDRLTEFIFQWISREIRGGLEDNSVMSEIVKFNMKLIYANSQESKTFLDFIPGSDVSEDGTFNRIQDLFVNIRINFPSYFIESIRLKHIDSLQILGYPVDDNIVKKIPYGWLFAKIQDIVRFRIKIGKPTSS